MKTEADIQKIVKYAKTHINFVILALVGSVLLFISFKTLTSKAAEIPSLLTEVGQSKEENEILRKRIAILQGSDSEKLTTFLDRGIDAIPLEKGSGSVLTAIDKLRQQSGVSIGEVALTPGLVSTQSAEGAPEVVQTSIPGVSSLDFYLKIQGNTDQTLEFVESLTRVRRLFGIQSLSAAFSEESDSIVVDLRISAFFSPLKPLVVDPNLARQKPLENLSASEINILGSVTQFPMVSKVSLDSDETGEGRIDIFMLEATPEPEESQ